jgi:hypothetical protein
MLQHGLDIGRAGVTFDRRVRSMWGLGVTDLNVNCHLRNWACDAGDIKGILQDDWKLISKFLKEKKPMSASVSIRLFCLTVLTTAPLVGAGTAFAQQSCIANSLPGHENFCLTKYDKNLPMTEAGCGSLLGPLHGSHLVLQCTAGVYKDKVWDLWCWGDGSGKCNISQNHLCTYSVERMKGAQEKNAGETCTKP